MYEALLHSHSSLRWLVVIFLTIAIIKSFKGWLGNGPFTKTDNIIALILLSVTHLQLVVGTVFYFTSDIVKEGFEDMASAMGNPDLRFWVVEHISIMIIAITLITLGRVLSKKASEDLLKHKKGAIFYTIAAILILWAGLIKPYLAGRGLY